MCPRLSTERSKAAFVINSATTAYHAVSLVLNNQAAITMRLLRVPIGMRRPLAAREVLGFSPLVQARGADASRVERVPLVAADAEPLILLAGRPAAMRAPDTRGF
jgi:hypothetical protein